MKRVTHKRCSGIVAGIVLAFFASPASAMFSNLITFGDSIVDAGNIETAFPGILPSPPYFMGRFTDGPNAADVLNMAVEGTLSSSSLLGGDNYAWGGAQARTDGGGFDGIPDFAEQLGGALGYLTAVGGVADPDALYMINFGGNDLFELLPVPGTPISGLVAETLIDDTVAAITGGVATLIGAGAAHIVVVGVGNVGFTPLHSGTPLNFAHGTLRSQQLNDELFAALPGSVMTLDTIDLFSDVFLNPTDFGLPGGIDFFDDCISAGAVGDYSAYAWVDMVHPTAPIHGILGGNLVTLVGIPIPGAVWLFGPALLALAGFARRQPTD